MQLYILLSLSIRMKFIIKIKILIHLYQFPPNKKFSMFVYYKKVRERNRKLILAKEFEYSKSDFVFFTRSDKRIVP